MMEEDLNKRSVNIANNIAETSSDYILIDDYYSLHLLLTRAKKTNEDVRYILIFNNKGDLLSSTFNDALPKGILNAHTPSRMNSIEYSTISSNEGRIHEVLVPIEQGDVGYVRVGMTEKKEKKYIYDKITVLVFITFIVCVGAAGVAYYVTSIITKPMNNLVETAIGITEGKLSLRAEVTGRDEISKLSEAFNKMADNLINSRNAVEKLLVELQKKEQLRDVLISKLITAQEDERKRISRELHDETSQALTSLMLTMRVLANEAKDDEQKKLLIASREITASILHDIRNLAVELRPPILDELGLIAALKKYAKRFEEGFGIQITLQVPNETGIELESHVSVALYRIFQESLNNVVKHTAATEVITKMQYTKNDVELIISDNGHGIGKDDFLKASRENRIGIYGMKERVELLGGTFSIKKREDTIKGTCITVSIPLVQKEGYTGGGNNKIMIADDHSLLRSGLKLLLQKRSTFKVVGEAANGCQAIELYNQLNPDILLLDISLPKLDGIQVLKKIKSRDKNAKVIILTMHEDEDYISSVMDLGAAGYVPKSAVDEELYSAIDTVLDGYIYLRPKEISTIMKRKQKAPVTKDLIEELSPREREVLGYLLNGYTLTEIAKELVLSIKTIDTHKTRIFNKLNITKKSELFEYAKRNNLL